MGNFEALDEIYDGAFVTTVRGKQYRIPQPNAKKGIALKRFFHDETAQLTDRQERREILSILGPVWDEMAKDGVPESLALFAGRVTLIHFGLGKEAAERYVRGGIDDPGNPLPRRWISPFRELMGQTTPAVGRIWKRLVSARGTTTGGKHRKTKRR